MEIPAIVRRFSSQDGRPAQIDERLPEERRTNGNVTRKKLSRFDIAGAETDTAKRVRHRLGHHIEIDIIETKIIREQPLQIPPIQSSARSPRAGMNAAAHTFDRDRAKKARVPGKNPAAKVEVERDVRSAQFHRGLAFL